MCVWPCLGVTSASKDQRALAMAAAAVTTPLTQRKRRRRRRQDRPCITARLVLDDHVKGDVGVLSDDMFADLFPQLVHRK